MVRDRTGARSRVVYLREGLTRQSTSETGVTFIHEVRGWVGPGRDPGP